MVSISASPQQVELTNALNQLCIGHASNIALNALLTNIAWITAEAIAKSPGQIDQMLDAVCDELRKAIKIQLQEVEDGPEGC